MAKSDDDPWTTEPRETKPAHKLGEPLDLLSVAEIDERIDMLRDEIRRLEAERQAKQASRTAANAFFKS